MTAVHIPAATSIRYDTDERGSWPFLDTCVPDTKATGRSVVIAEDDTILRDSIERLLIREGIEVTSATNGVDALELLNVQQPTVLVLDLGLPRMRGQQLLHLIKMRQCYGPSRVIVVTGDATDETRDRVLAMGATTFLAKPVRPQLLVAAVLGNVL